MAGVIDAKAPLDYIEFQIFPRQNRYETCICYDRKLETVTPGLLEQLVLNSPDIKELQSRGSDANYRLKPPENHEGAKWFTKSTLMRFLHIVGSSNILNITNEIYQLEEARSFHLSLYAKGRECHLGSIGIDSGNSHGATSNPKDKIETVSSETSKNELLRALDLRLTALRGELATAFGQAASPSCSAEDMDDILMFSHHFGAVELGKSLCKFVEMSQEKQTVNHHSDEHLPSENESGNDKVSTKGHAPVPKPVSSDTPVKYGVSPAKVAQIERQSSSDSGESSYSSEEDQPSAERSRPLIRSASPRRSASPMRRIQIGRSGSRRATALTIKSLNHFPARERLVSHKDAANSSDEEGTEQSSRKPENNVRRMSVQDAISLFESKQKSQIVDIQKTKALLHASNANKSVLRRWSAGMGESSSQCPPGLICNNSAPTPTNNLEDTGISNSLQEPELKSDLPIESNSVEHDDVDIKSESPEEAPATAGMQEDVRPAQVVETDEKITASEWSRQKEAELNQLLIKMMETKPIRYRNVAPNGSKIQNSSNEQRGGFYEDYKEKRDTKLRGETAKKKAEKDKQSNAVQHVLSERKAEIATGKASDIHRKNTVKKPLKTEKNLTKSTNSKQETPKAAPAKKASSKASALPATRKSWPGPPSSRGTATSPVKASTGKTTGTASLHRRSLPASSVPQLSSKVEKSKPRPKPTKTTQQDSNNSVKSSAEKGQLAAKGTSKMTTTKSQTASTGPDSPAKPRARSKVTKKSSVVPVESKPFLRKGTGIGSGVSPAVKSKVNTQPLESLKSPRDLIQPAEDGVFPISSVTVQQPPSDLEILEIHKGAELESQVESLQNSDVTESRTQVPSNDNDNLQQPKESALKTEDEEELGISPTAWVEIEEHDNQTLTSSDNIGQVESPPTCAPMGMSSPRVRHSLSQMLLEESSEPDIIEWGNAENPPALVYQKDSPKGFKRLLKFARKSKGDANSSGWSTPSVFSEGEDDGEESKAANKRGSDNLLKKATLHAMTYGDQKGVAACEAYDRIAHAAHGNTSRLTAQSLSQRLQEGHVSASGTTSKATRSFFSLSAFKGSKQNDAKLR